MDFTAQQKLGIKSREVELLKKALRETVSDLARAKEIIDEFQMAQDMADFIIEGKNKVIRMKDETIERQNKELNCYKRIVSG